MMKILVENLKIQNVPETSRGRSWDILELIWRPVGPSFCTEAPLRPSFGPQRWHTVSPTMGSKMGNFENSQNVMESTFEAIVGQEIFTYAY